MPRGKSKKSQKPTSQQKCSYGLEVLQSLGLSPNIDNFKIIFKDPLGLSSDLCKIQNRYAFQGTCRLQYNSQTRTHGSPVLYIDGQDMGTIENLKIQAIKALAEPSSFGSEIKGSRINLELRVSDNAQILAPMGNTIVPKLDKLMIYEKDKMFVEHADPLQLHAENHIGTLLVCLPVPYEGGAIILSDEGNELKLHFDNMAKNNRIPWIIFYNDVKYKVEVKSGVTMMLQYDLIAEKKNKEYDIRAKIGGRYFREPDYRYRFQGCNKEVIDAIRDKLNKILGQQKESKLDGQDEEEKKEEKDEESDEEEEYKNLSETTHPEGIAIMLKRRYETSFFSSDKLKGSDKVLYNSLKDHFTLEFRHIILEQNHSEYSKPIEQLIEVVTISQINDLHESCSSEEELQVDQDNLHIPVSCNKKDKKCRSVKLTHQQKFGKKKNVFFVAGIAPKEISPLVERYGDDNNDYESVYSYIHSVLVVYPKS